IKTVWGSGSTGAKSLWPGTGIPRLTGVGTAPRWTRPWALTPSWPARRPWTTRASRRTRLMASFAARATSPVAVAVPRRNGRGGENADDYARGARQWTVPWGNHGGNDFINIFPHNQYCLKYGGTHDDLAPFVINQHRNGLLTPWGFNATHGIEKITVEDYVTS